MALPSSPPSLAQSSGGELPSSPLLLPTTSASSLPVLGKRQLSEYDSNVSSDPLFSDDTSGNEDATIYQRPKRKRMIRGKWWELAERRRKRNDATPKQKQYTRNIDSGVWMGSDGSEESVGDGVHTAGGAMNVQERPQATQTTRPVVQSRPTPRSLAEDIITRSVEDGRARVDLSQLGLGELHSSTLRPLHELIRQPVFDTAMPPSDDELGPLTPDLQLYLASNELTSLPDELFRLENMTVLSLRNNALAELPGALCRLRRLKELNLANNNLSHLPWDLLDVLRSRQTRVILHPNPYLEPRETDGSTHEDVIDPSRFDEPKTIWAELSHRLFLGRELRKRCAGFAETAQEDSSAHEELTFLASSDVRYSDIDGYLVQDMTAAPHEFVVSLGPASRPAQLGKVQRAPSLVELSLRSAHKHFDLSQVPANIPARIQSLLQAANRTAFEQRCSSCGHGYIIARAEWVEYWHRGSHAKAEVTPESVLPFMRRACSWACATPTEMLSSHPASSENVTAPEPLSC